MIIAIDGPAGSGKSTTAQRVAQRLGIMHLDTGAMYRAITLKSLREKIRPSDADALAALLKRTSISFTGTVPDIRVWLDGEDVTVAVRGDEVTKNVSDFCAPRVVREAMVRLQRELAHAHDVVCEGRDIGTVVFPGAELKFFLVASVDERARRRQKDFARLGVHKSIEELCAEILERDQKDATREISPLRKADDAEEIDTTHMTLDEQAEYIINRASRRGLQSPAGA